MTGRLSEIFEIEQTLSREIDFPVSVEENPEEW